MGRTGIVRDDAVRLFSREGLNNRRIVDGPKEGLYPSGVKEIDPGLRVKTAGPGAERGRGDETGIFFGMGEMETEFE